MFQDKIDQVRYWSVSHVVWWTIATNLMKHTETRHVAPFIFRHVLGNQSHHINVWYLNCASGSITPFSSMNSFFTKVSPSEVIFPYSSFISLLNDRYWQSSFVETNEKKFEKCWDLWLAKSLFEKRLTGTADNMETRRKHELDKNGWMLIQQVLSLDLSDATCSD